MRNLLVFYSSTLFFSGLVSAQAYRTTYTFQKNLYPAAAIQVPYEEDVVTDAVKDYMTGKGYKDAHYKDFMIFRSVPLENGSAVYSDAYFNISRKSRSEKDISIFFLIPVKKEASLSTSAEEDSSYITRSMVFLDS